MIAVQDPYNLFAAASQQSPNPFLLESVISAEEVWGEVMTDLPSLNQQIDQTVDRAISQIRQKISTKIGIAIKGDRGTGKSHAIHRIWKSIEREGKALFCYIPPCKNPGRIDTHVRFNLCLDFARQDTQGVTQWQKLAAATIATLQGTEFEEEYQQYIEKSSQPNQLRKQILSTVEKSELEDFFDELTGNIKENQPGLDYDFLKAVLFTLFKHSKVAQTGLAWLKGEDHPSIKQAGLPEYSAEQQQLRDIWMIKQICELAKIVSKPVVICLDQLDAVEADAKTGDSKAEVVAKCIDRIHFECSNVIFLCCVIADTWREIEQMGSGTPDRVGEWSVSSKPPTADQMVELVKLRLDWFYKQNNLDLSNYPYLYPFKEVDLRKVAGEAPGVRFLFKNWCAEKFEKGDKPLNRQDEFLGIYNQLLDKITIPLKDKDDEKLTSILTCAMRMIPTSGAAGVEVKQVIDVGASSSHDLHLIVVGFDSTHQKKVRIGIRVCETPTGVTFNAVMKRLLDYRKHQLTRGCLVRSTPIPHNWKRGKELETQLTAKQGGEVVVLKKEEINHLAVLERIYQQSADYGFEKDEVIALAKELRLVAGNPLVCEILSAPI